jgi:hypothetical protein
MDRVRSCGARIATFSAVSFLLSALALAQGGLENERVADTGVPASLDSERGAAQSTAYDASRWWPLDSDRTFPTRSMYENEHGALTTLRDGDPLPARGHPFFTPIGTNGRACVTCHQPADAMSLSVATIQARWRATRGTDPLFAAVDGSNCPHLPQDQASSHSLLLERGLIRIFRPWPPVAPDGSPIEPQFDIEIVRDPTGCNTHPQYGLESSTPLISVYRRPRPATNVKYLTAVGFPFEPKNGLPLPVDPESGLPMSGNLTADGRNGTLKLQIIDAFRTHMRGAGEPDAEALRSLIDFETTVYSAILGSRRQLLVTPNLSEGISGSDARSRGQRDTCSPAQHPQHCVLRPRAGRVGSAPPQPQRAACDQCAVGTLPASS